MCNEVNLFDVLIHDNLPFERLKAIRFDIINKRLPKEPKDAPVSLSEGIFPYVKPKPAKRNPNNETRNPQSPKASRPNNTTSMNTSK